MRVVEAAMHSLGRHPLLLTIEEAAGVLRIGRSLAYELARRYEASDGHLGLAVMRVGSCWRVPRWALAELVASCSSTHQAVGPTTRRTSTAAGPMITVTAATLNSSGRQSIGQPDEATGREQLGERPTRHPDVRAESKHRQSFATIGRLVLVRHRVRERSADPHDLRGFVDRQQWGVLVK